jgi:hypothetical protein
MPYDDLLQRRLEGLGCTVQLRGDAVVKVDDTAGKSVVVIGESAKAGLIGTRLRDVRAGVFTLEGFMAPLMGMSGPAQDSDFGETLAQQLVITQPSHPLAAALTGVVDVLTTPGILQWAKPSTAATVVATMVGRNDLAAVYAYEAGAMMVGLVAPARRVALGSDQATAPNYTDGMWRLFDAAARWAASRP